MSVVARPALAALAAVAVAAVALVKVRPQRIVDSDAMALEGVHGCRRTTVVRVVDAWDVGRVVVDEVTCQLPTEVRVGLRVEDERVPPDVDELRRIELSVGLVLDEGEEGQGLIHDALGEVPLDPLVLDDSVDESLPKLLVEHLLVRQFKTRNHLHGGDVDNAHDALFLSILSTGVCLLSENHTILCVLMQVFIWLRTRNLVPGSDKIRRHTLLRVLGAVNMHHSTYK